MSIAIDRNKCINCSRCVLTCPGSLIYEDGDGKATIKYPKDCWGCTACIKVCPTDAISYHLGTDLGGTGAEMVAEDKGDKVVWTMRDGEREERIEIKRSDSNRY